jgi:secondary thiamine-phosphate synthase enzyme
MKKVTIATEKRKQVVDITDEINDLVKKTGVKSGLCHLYVTHTTCCLTTADLDPGTDLDMLDAYEKMIPKLKYRHPHDPSHVSDHILSSLIGPSVSIPIEKSSLVLGTWQRVVLIEFYGPREREIIVNFFVLNF